MYLGLTILLKGVVIVEKKSNTKLIINLVLCALIVLSLVGVFTVKGSLASNGKKLATAKAAGEALQETITGLEEQVDALKDAAKETKATIKDYEGQIKTLNTQIEELNTQLEELQNPPAEEPAAEADAEAAEEPAEEANPEG